MSSHLNELIQIMARLRAPGGCPWDHEQTHKTLIPFLIEEAYEVIDAIESGNPTHLREELGDLLLQVVFHAQIAQDDKRFTIEDVAQGIAEKLIRRHPHVFADATVSGADEVTRNWDTIKKEEKKNQVAESVLDSIPKSAPALFQAYELGKKTSKESFDWDHVEDVMAKIEEEVAELKEALKQNNSKEIQSEMGDIFFAISNLSRHLQINPEEALRGTNNRFRKRYLAMEKKLEIRGQKMKDLSTEEKNNLWEEVKKEQSS